MRPYFPVAFFMAILTLFLLLGGCLGTITQNNTPIVTPTPPAMDVNMNVTPVPVPTKFYLTTDDVTFLKNAIDQGSSSIRMIGDVLTLIRSGRYDAARTAAESAEKNLKLQYDNLSAQSVSPALQPVKDEILAAIQDEMNGTRKLRNIAVSDSEMMSGASKDYRDAADMLFRSANTHLNNAQSKINELNNK